MIVEGDIVCTNYGTGPYVVVEIHRGCRCPDYLAWIDCDGSPCRHELSCEEDCPLTRDTPPHLHLICVDLPVFEQGRWRRDQLRWLNGYVQTAPNRLQSAWRDGDYIDIVGHAAGVQQALALE